MAGRHGAICGLIRQSGNVHAVVLAGGRGVRLRPYTTRLPKPLVPIGDEHAILDIVLHQLSAAGFDHVTLAIGFLGQLVKAYIGDGDRFGLRVDYWDEVRPLGTMGPLVAHRDELPEQVLVINGDVLTDLDLASVMAGHAGSCAPLTVCTYRRDQLIDFGVLVTEGDRIVEFREKPVEVFQVSMGVYVVSAGTFDPYPRDEPLGFDELVLDLLSRGQPPRVHPFDGYWLDIGRPDDYERANEEWPTMRDRLLPGVAT